MKLIQRIVSLALVLVMVCGIFPVTALAATEEMLAANDTVQEDTTPTETTAPNETDPQQTLSEGTETPAFTETETPPVTVPDGTAPTGETIPTETAPVTVETTAPETEAVVTKPEETDATVPVREETAPKTEATEPSTEATTPAEEDAPDPEESVTATVFTFNENGEPEYLNISVQQDANGGISTFAIAEDVPSATHYIRIRLLRNSSEPGFTFTYQGKSYTNNALYVHGIKINGVASNAYCIDPGLAVDTSNGGYSGSGTSWDSLDKNTQMAIGLTLLYGAPNGMSSSDAKTMAIYELATQTIIQEIMLGYRSSSNPFTCTNSRMIDFWSTKADGSANVTRTLKNGVGSHYSSLNNMSFDLDEQQMLRKAYNDISAKLAKHYVIPSFSSDDSDFAQTYEMTLQSNGTYAVTLTDTNGILSACTFQNGNGLTYSVSGNKLTITATSTFTGTKSCGYTSSNGGGYKDLPSLTSSAFLLWSSGTLQRLVSLVSEGENDPVPFFFNVRLANGTAQVQKVLPNGGTLQGWQFTIYSDAACTKAIATKTADANGRVLFTGLSHGITYYIKETGDAYGRHTNGFWDLDESVKAVTAQSGTTVTVEFENRQLGKAQVQKILPNGGTLEGWQFTLYADAACTKAITTKTADKDGRVLFTGLVPGTTYYIKETGDAYGRFTNGYWDLDESVKAVTAVAGQTITVEFKNLLCGSAQVQKKITNYDSYGSRLGGWQFTLYSDAECTQAIETKETDWSGVVLFTELIPGTTYYIKETGDADGRFNDDYWKIDESVKTVTAVLGETVTVEFENKILGLGRIRKVVNTPDWLAEGWAFQLFKVGSDGSLSTVGVYKTDRNGCIDLYLDPGKYAAMELPNESKYYNSDLWDCDTSYHYFTVYAEKTTEIIVENVYKTTTTGHLQIIKTVRSPVPQVIALQGWEFNIYSVDASDPSITTLVGTYTTDSTGIIKVDLEPGEYLVEEIVPEETSSQKYVCLSENPQRVTVEKGKTAVVQFENVWKNGWLHITKEFAEGSSGTLKGWQFNIYRGTSTSEDDLVATLTSSIIGACNTTLEAGVYTVLEVLPEDSPYYVADENPKVVTIDYNTDHYISFVNAFRDGTVQIVKTFSEGTSGSLAGWQFQIYEGTTVDPEKLIDTVTTEADGMIAVDLFPGTYTFLEVIDPDSKYECASENPVTVTVEPGGRHEVAFENTFKDGRLNTKKTLAEGSTGSLEGWIFQIYEGSSVDNTKLLATEVTDAHGNISIDLTPGTYTILEVLDDVTDYYCTSENPQVVTIEPNETHEVIFENALYPGTIEIQKYLIGGADGSLEGWEIQIYEGSEVDPEALVATLYTDENGVAEIELLPGEYTIFEVIPEGSDYYCSSLNPRTVTVTSNTTQVIAIENAPYPGSLSIRKTFAEGTTGSLAGWQFEIYAGTEISEDTFIDTVTTNENGYFNTTLSAGVYTVIEVLPDDSAYYCTTEPQVITIRPNGNHEVTFVNAFRPGKITLTKVNGEGRYLKGATFLLEWSEDGKSWFPVAFTETGCVVKGGCSSSDLADGTLTTGGHGIVTFEGLHPELQYRVTELEAPEGYRLLSSYAYVGKLPSDTLELQLKVVNFRKYIFPAVGALGTTEIIAGGTLLTVLALAVCIVLSITVFNGRRAVEKNNKRKDQTK